MSRNNYFEHDNRSDSYRPMGRGRKFNSRNNNKYRGGYSGGNRLPRHADHDGDVEMNSAGGSRNNERRFNPYDSQKMNGRRRRDRKKFGKPFPRDEIDSHERLWYKVTIPHGRKLGKQFILRSLLSNSKEPVVPFNFQFDGHAAFFFVNNHNSAMSIKDVNRRVSTPDGFKMAVFVSKSGIPYISIDAEATEQMKTTMSNRYDVANHALNLKKFHFDPDFQSNGFYLPINKTSIACTAMKIIKEHIPEIEALDLSDNRIMGLDSFHPLVQTCKQLTTLVLQNNKLKSATDLNPLKGLGIVNLVLDGNPLCDDFKDKTSYISAVRERFPSLMKLDGQDLPAPIGFDLGSENVPTSKGSFFLAEDVKGLVIQFLEQYYTIYDSGDREKLLEAYHEQASFSLTTVKSIQKGATPSPYLRESRNLLRVSDSNYRHKLLKQGRISVVSLLSKLPQTQHDPHSFVVDIFHVSPGLMAFSVAGVFKEVGDDSSSLKTFHRSFLVTGQGQGFVVANEMLFLTNATSDQVKAFKFPAPTPSPSPAPPSTIADKTPMEKQQLAIEFHKATGMNLDFAAKCLEENDWDCQKAFMVFTELNNLGRIPPEAFQMK